VSRTGEVLIEKHWRRVTPRSFVELFWEEVGRCGDPRDMLPVVATANLYLVNVFREGLFLLCAISEETPPLLAVEFLVSFHFLQFRFRIR